MQTLRFCALAQRVRRLDFFHELRVGMGSDNGPGAVSQTCAGTARHGAALQSKAMALRLPAPRGWASTPP